MHLEILLHLSPKAILVRIERVILAHRTQKSFTQKLFRLFRNFAQPHRLTRNAYPITMSALFEHQWTASRAAKDFSIYGLACRSTKCYKAKKRRIQTPFLCPLNPLSNARFHRI
jgi:hypothetical protein